MLNEQALSAYINVMFEPPGIRAQRHQTSLTTAVSLPRSSIQDHQIGLRPHSVRIGHDALCGVPQEKP